MLCLREHSATHFATFIELTPTLSTQVNVLSPILLTLLLAPLLRRSLKGDRSTTRCLPNIDIPRIIFTGSDVAEIAVTTGLDSKHPLRGLDDEATYKAEHRYYQSKVGSQPFVSSDLIDSSVS